MSKDIRSYFGVSPKNQIDVKKKKTKKVLSDSDSDSDTTSKDKKRSPTKCSPNKKGLKKNEVKSSYFTNLKPVNPQDVFSSSKIKRIGVPVKPKKGLKFEEKNNLQDDDFDSTLLLLDDKSVEKLVNESSVKIKNSNINHLCDNSNVDKSVKDSKHVINENREKANIDKIDSIYDSSYSKSVNNNNDHVVLSESSDSEAEIKQTKKIKVDRFKKLSPVKVKSVEKTTTAAKKNDCMDLSESDSDQESIKICRESNIVNTDKKNINLSTSSSQGLKTIEDNTSLKTGQKRKLESDNFTNLKKLKSFAKDHEYPAVKTPVIKAAIPLISNLWVDKYKPKSLKQVIGQQGDKSNVKKLVNWLTNWRKNHDGKKKLIKPSPWAKDDDGAFFKAALLSGPPGVGKTTTAHLACKELDFDVVEFNASDTRSKKSLQEEVSELLSSKSLAPYFTGNLKQDVTCKHVLLMDEVDGMAGTEDRGGMQELIQLIKKSRVPIICMCNDRNHPKIRSLVNYCFDLRFSRPRVEQIKGAMMSICFKEHLKITPDRLTDIIKSTNQDIRLILNHLSVLAAQRDSNLPNSEKCIKLGPWDVLRKVFSEEESKTMSFIDKRDLFFHDYSIAPLFVQENYINVIPHAKLNKIEKMKKFAIAAESISTGDIIEKTIRSSNAWSLLPVEAIFASVIPGETLKGHMGGTINFPSWFGKNSSKNKIDRLQQEILGHTRLKVSGSKEAINLDYSRYLYDLILRPLILHGSEDVQDALNALHSYDLIKEDLESLSELCKWPNKKNPMDQIESKVKAAFTRAYNKSSSLSPYAMTSAIKKGRSGTSAEIDSAELLHNEDVDAVVDEIDEDEDNVEVDAMILVKKKTSKKQQQQNVSIPSSSKQRGSGKRGGRGSRK